MTSVNCGYASTFLPAKMRRTWGGGWRSRLGSSLGSGRLGGLLVVVMAGLGGRNHLLHSTKLPYEPMKPRDLMAPDTEPTDEELALVMREARELAAERRLKSDAWVAARIEEANRFARENARPRRTRGQK